VTLPLPRRHWRSDRPLPSSIEALAEPFGAFPSWVPVHRIRARCGKERLLNEALATSASATCHSGTSSPCPAHEGCGGWATKAELLTDPDGASNRPVLRGGWNQGLARREGFL
jgi:hypothetical protein